MAGDAQAFMWAVTSLLPWDWCTPAFDRRPSDPPGSSKRGNKQLRSLLLQDARAVMRFADGERMRTAACHKPFCVAVTAMSSPAHLPTKWPESSGQFRPRVASSGSNQLSPQQLPRLLLLQRHPHQNLRKCGRRKQATVRSRLHDTPCFVAATGSPCDGRTQ